MKRIINKARSTFQDSLVFPNTQDPYPNPNATQQPLGLTTPTSTDVFRYRYHHGANLGSIFVLERWLHGSMFPPQGGGDAEIDAVTASVQAIGVQATKQKWEQHWASALTDSDLAWLCHEARCTSIRLPIGYFTLGKQFSKNTPFEDFAEVYEGAWEAVKVLVRRAAEWGIGVLIDLHALPGGANTDAHSGCSTGKAEFWHSRKFKETGKECAAFIASEVRNGLPGVVGIQLVNEAIWNAKGMWDWYDDIITRVGQIDASIPIYVSDAWEINKASSWMQKRTTKVQAASNPVIIDTHKYYTFSDEDRSLAPGQIIEKVPGEAAALQGISVVVGEYSCVLDGQTWSRVPEHEKESYVRQFGQVQSQGWQENTSGSYFWTLKMDWMDGGEWGFVEQTKKGNITPPPYMSTAFDEVKQRAHEAHLRKEELGTNAMNDHVNYWNGAAPGKKMEHERFSEGWNLGYGDALMFYTMRSNGGLGRNVDCGTDRLGCLEAWIQKRLRDTGGQVGEFAWEWEHGFKTGVQAMNQVVGL